MHLDVLTLSLGLFLVYAVNSLLVLFMMWSGRTFPGGRLWFIALVLLTLGASTNLLRPVLPPWVSIVLGNLAYLTGLLVFAHSVWNLKLGRPFPGWFYLLLVPVAATFGLVIDASFGFRSLVYSLWSAVLSAWPAWLLLWRSERRFRLSNALTSLPFAIASVASVSRFVWNWLVPDQGDFLTQEGGNALYFLGSLVISPVTLFGYFMLSWNRAEDDLQRKDEEIEARNRKLLVSARSKDLFFSIIAHDLRGPIGGAARYVRKHLLGKLTGLEPKYNEVETLASALEKTNEFLEKLLWWSRAQLQDWTPEQVPVDLSQVFEQTRSLVQSAAEAKEITIEWAPPPYPKPLTDPDSVHLILGNLLSNAVKFSLPGRSIRVWVETQEPLCRVIVEDRGVGMDAATLERLFRIEDKLSTHGTSGERGSGLGLILARSLAERNNGGVTIESRPGEGTKATLWLPLAKS